MAFNLGSKFARRCTSALVCTAAIAMSVVAVPVLADDAPYAGIWATEQQYCGAPPSDPNSPLAITAEGYDQHETHCAFKSIEQKDGDYKISADCTIEGDRQASNFALTVSGNTLTFTDETGARDFLRCN